MNLARVFKRYMPIESESAIFLGEFRLLDNPSFCADFLSYTASQANEFPSYTQWIDYLKKTYKTPEKPDKDNPYLYKQEHFRYSNHTKALAYRNYIYLQKMEQYYKSSSEIRKKRDKQASITNKYSLDEQGYCQYVYTKLGDDNKAFLDHFQAFYINEKDRIKHSYLSGGSGSGKSEFLKILLHHYVKQKDPQECIILIDPHSKISAEVAQFVENSGSDRLIVVEATKQEGKNAVLNPLTTDLSDITAQSVDILSQELTGAFKEVLQDSGFTIQMETLLKPCLATLLMIPDSNLYHLQQMMNDEVNQKYLDFAEKNLHNPSQRNFLKNDFLKPAYSPSKRSITTKLQSLLNSQVFIDFTIGKSTIDLKQAIEQKKIILFNLSRQSGVETSDTIGRLLLSTLQGLAMQRGHDNATPIHLFVDECQHYVTPSIEFILTETRKYKLFLTLANQFDSQITNKITRSAIRGNTHIKVVARQTEPETLDVIQRSMGVHRSVIANLNIGEYFVKVGNYQGVVVKTNSDLVDNNNAMSMEQWEEVEGQQLEKYYVHKDDNILFSPPSFGDKQPSKRKGLN